MNRNHAKVVDGLVDAVRELNVGNVGRAGAAAADGAASASAEHAAGSSRKGAVDAGLESAKIKLELNKGSSGLDHVDKTEGLSKLRKQGGVCFRRASLKCETENENKSEEKCRI